MHKLFSLPVLGVFLVGSAFAQPAEPPVPACPENQACKIVILTQPELDALLGANAIFDVAEWGRRFDLAPPIAYFRKKLNETPMIQPVKKP